MIAWVRVAVVGAGVVGLSATASLLERGAEVVCYERSISAMSERSAGSSRIFRLAHSTPDLVRLAQSARAGFRRWEEDAGTPLITKSGCVVSGADVAGWARTMEAAGAPCEVVEAPSDRVRLPAVALPSESLIDPSGGVVDVDSVRAHLVALTRDAVVHEPVYALESGPVGATVWSPTGKACFDAVVVAAGAGTSALAAQVGIYTPTSLAHHFRFTFPIDRFPAWQCWIDKPAIGLSTYQHQSGPGMWSVGGQVDPALTAWEVGREAAAAASKGAVLRHVREQLTVEPRILDSLYCSTTPNLGDGFEVRRNGSILAVYGDNLFKLAPVLGEVLAVASTDGSTPSVKELASS
jgi:sarcosine oxidase